MAKNDIVQFGATRILEASIAPSQVSANVTAEQTFTVSGLSTADAVFISPVATGNSTMAGTARVSAADTLAVTYTNPTGGALTPATGTMRILAVRF